MNKLDEFNKHWKDLSHLDTEYRFRLCANRLGFYDQPFEEGETVEVSNDTKKWTRIEFHGVFHKHDYGYYVMLPTVNCWKYMRKCNGQQRVGH